MGANLPTKVAAHLNAVFSFIGGVNARVRDEIEQRKRDKAREGLYQSTRKQDERRSPERHRHSSHRDEHGNRDKDSRRDRDNRRERDSERYMPLQSYHHNLSHL